MALVGPLRRWVSGAAGGRKTTAEGGVEVEKGKAPPVHGAFPSA